MAKFKVTWTEQYNCSATIEAPNAEEAIATCYDIDNPKRELAGTSDWASREEEQ